MTPLTAIAASRTRRRPRAAALALLAGTMAVAACAACAAADTQSADQLSADSAFAAVQARGADLRGMGVDQYTSVHRFDAFADGGRIELQRGTHDPAGVAQVRRHLRGIAAAFGRGDFATPAFVHMREVPGTAVMAAESAAISYAYRDLPRGGEVRITARTPAAVTVELLVPVPRAIASRAEVTATLRCLQERFEERGTGKGRSTEVVCYELAAPPAIVALAADGCGGSVLRTQASVPADAPATALGALPPRYWEVELAAARPGVDYAATFLVPVY